MAHDEIQPLADVTAAPMTLQHKLGTLEQQRRLRGVFLGCKLVQTPVQIYGDTQIHRHSIMVPNQYQAAATGKVAATGAGSIKAKKRSLSAFNLQQ